MLYASIFVSLLLLFFANLASGLNQKYWGYKVISLICYGFCFLLVIVLLGPVCTQFLLLGAGVLATFRYQSLRRWVFPIYSIAVVILSYLVVLPSVFDDLAKVNEIRQKYAFEPIDARTPRVQSGSSPQFTEADLVAIEELESESLKSKWESRVNRLKVLHRSQVNHFVNSPGFGKNRISISIRGLALSLERLDAEQDILIAQPAPRTGSVEEQQTTRVEADEHLRYLHKNGLIDFIDPARYGYNKDQQTAGFLSHRFSQVPSSNSEWKLSRLELVSLLIHNEPKVYVSEYLPRMDQLKHSETRPLDQFELDALKSLRSGQEIVVAAHQKGLRMLRSIRATQNCIQCHGGQRGELLGAFTYDLRK